MTTTAIEPTKSWHWDDSPIGVSFLRDPSGEVFGAVFRSAQTDYTHEAIRLGELIATGNLAQCKQALERLRDSTKKRRRP